MLRYHDMLRNEIREFVSLSGCETLNDMIARARKHDINIDHLGKRKFEQTRITVG